MNLNINFQISSENDLVLDSRVHEIILLQDRDVLDAQTGADGSNVEGAGQATSLFSG